MVLVDIFEEINENFVSEIGDKYSVEAISEVWKNICKLIGKYLQNNKSISLKNIGLFTLGKWSLDSGIRRKLSHFEPVFKLSKSVLEHFDLHQSKQYTDDKVPIASVNYCALATECNIDKECVLYALQAVAENLWKVLYRNDDVRLDFPELGTLFIKNQLVIFKFTKMILPVKLNPPKICVRFNAALSKYLPQEKFPCEKHHAKNIYLKT
ncbi:uncharacterized protein isoform X2 [Rhodnius prolixus]|uniref:CCDC81 HU domain-containing protein n=2 Tax=Rhodnius prolixus TaxID=13249 RepID=T1HIE7_RHOPR